MNDDTPSTVIGPVGSGEHSGHTRDTVLALVTANPGLTTEEVAARLGCDRLAADEYLYRMGRALGLERDEQRRWWHRPNGRCAHDLAPYPGEPEFQQARRSGGSG